jgi:2',3'-cyclic-nucleotide 2'-phosphodiesterase (5'-nucleotidase family)
MDGDAPLSVGELVAMNPTALDAAGVKALFEAIMLEQTGADLAHYPAVGVAGRLRAGPIRTGDLYTLENWRDRLAVVEVKGANLADPMRTELRSRGSAVQLRRTYRIATVRYVADELADEVLGTVESDETGAMLRDVAIAHLTERGFPSHG